jgi:hypothetical protein
MAAIRDLRNATMQQSVNVSNRPIGNRPMNRPICHQQSAMDT